jgi:hypothetical protein
MNKYGRSITVGKKTTVQNIYEQLHEQMVESEETRICIICFYTAIPSP